MRSCVEQAGQCGQHRPLPKARRVLPSCSTELCAVILGRLAHNLVVWARHWLAPEAPSVRQLGVKRLVRDVFHVNGVIERDAAGHIRQIVLNQAHCYARRFLGALQALVGAEQVAVSLGET